MGEPETIPQHWAAAARRYGARKVAMRQKRLGIWRETTWQEVYTEVRDLALGLVELGLQRGDRVAIVGDNDCEYIWADLAALCAGGAGVGIFTDSTSKEIEYMVSHSDALFVFAKNQEQCDKLLEVKTRLPQVKRVIYWDDRGMWNYRDPWLSSLTSVQALGRVRHERNPEEFEALIAAGRRKDPAIFCYTSGTTGQPKGAVLSHGYFLFVEGAISRVDPRYPTDNHMSFLSLAWVAEHVYGVTAHAADHLTMNFPEEPETLQQDIREIAPQELLYNSRLWENLVRTVQARINDSTRLNQLLYRLGLRVAFKMADHIFEKKPLDPWLRLQYAAANLLVLAPLRDQLGLSHVRTAHTTGAALGPDVVRFFRALGINLKQVYGVTETGIAVMHRDDDIDFYSVGQPIPGYEIQISAEGEILISHDNLFLGYHKNEAATQKAFHIDKASKRWFRTGDAGRFDDHGHLVYFDRMDDMIQLPSGDKYSPQYIEGHLTYSPNIRAVMTIGGGLWPFVTALVTIDFENVGRWAERRGIAYTTYADLSQKPEVLALLQEEVARVNRVLQPRSRVRRFVSLPKEFDPDEGEMTRTRKLRRKFLHERYKGIIQAMYDGLPSVVVSSTVQYRDGRSGTVETSVRIADMELDKQLEALAA